MMVKTIYRSFQGSHFGVSVDRNDIHASHLFTSFLSSLECLYDAWRQGPSLIIVRQ